MDEKLKSTIVDAYKKRNKEASIEKDLLLLRRNNITSLEEWSALSNEKKRNYDDLLVDILDDASLPQGMSFDL